MKYEIWSCKQGGRPEDAELLKTVDAPSAEIALTSEGYRQVYGNVAVLQYESTPDVLRANLSYWVEARIAE